MLAATWTDMIPLIVTQIVTLVVAFGLWRLTTRNDRTRWHFERRFDAYLHLYASMLTIANRAREPFLDPTNTAANELFNDVGHTNGVDFARALMYGSTTFMTDCQAEIRDAVNALEVIIAERRTSGVVWTVPEAQQFEHWGRFLAVRQRLFAARNTLVNLARAETDAYVANKKARR